MKNFNFDGWEDFIEITLFGETHKVRLGTFEDSLRINKVQEELNNAGDNEICVALIEFVVDRFNEAGAKFTVEQFMKLAPAKVVAISRAITQGANDDNPLDGVVS